MNSTEEKMLCVKCGAEMKKESRCCLKCGNLNPYHEANQAYFAKLAEMHHTTYNAPPTVQTAAQTSTVQTTATPQIAAPMTPAYAGGVPATTTEVAQPVPAAKDNSTSFMVCSIINGIFVLLQLFIVVFIFLSEGISSSVGIFLLLFGIYNLVFYGWEIFCMEMGHSWWSIFVPIYGNMVMADIAMGNMLIGLLTLLPAVGEIVLFVIFYQLGDKMNKSGIVTALFFPIVVAMFGFGACSYICENEKKNSFNRFLHKGIYYYSFIALIAGILLLIFF